jgi:lipoprotein-anchoring transpeptidase ErfK/SrfK
MTNSVAAIASAATTADTQRAQAASSPGTSFAQVQAAAVKTTDASDSSSKTSTDDTKKKTAASAAPKGERTQKVEGHNYVEIIAGPRNGMFINNTGTTRDGQAFLIVKRHGREFHVYGSGDDRKVFEVGRKRETDSKDASGTTDAKTTDSKTSGTTDTSAASTTGTAGSGTTAA